MSHHHHHHHSSGSGSHHHHHHQHRPSYHDEDPTLRISQEDLSYIARTQRHLSSSSQRTTGGSPASTRSSSSSTAASGGGAQISLDPKALAQLSAHFDGLLGAITQRVDALSEQTQRSTAAHHRRSITVVERADREMERLREILRQCDELQTEFLKIKRIGDIVRGFR